MKSLIAEETVDTTFTGRSMSKGAMQRSASNTSTNTLGSHKNRHLRDINTLRQLLDLSYGN